MSDVKFTRSRFFCTNLLLSLCYTATFRKKVPVLFLYKAVAPYHPLFRCHCCHPCGSDVYSHIPCYEL